MASQVDLIIIALAVLLPLLFWFRESLPFIGGSKKSHDVGHVAAAGGDGEEGDPRDFVGKMKRAGKRCVVFYGTQTGTAEEYSIRLAKEAKSRYGLSSLVCDPEEYDFNNLDQVPEDCCVFFVMATYGEGDPTDNAEQFWEFIMEENVQFSQGGDSLENLNYVIFGLGNRTYEHFNGVGRKLDAKLAALGAHRVGTLGEGDDDKALEEDYLEWKDPMWEDFANRMNVEEGGAGDVADFVVTEINPDEKKVYHGELSSRALLATTSGTSTPVGSYNSKNPYASPVLITRELFAVDGERNCVHIEFDLTGSGLSYQHGDHVGVWPSNPDLEVVRTMTVLGLLDKRNAVVDIVSLDPALAKVPFPTPATYEAIFRHYIDVAATASRQTIAFLARYAPNEEAKEKLTLWGNDKNAYHDDVDGPRLTLAEVLMAAAGDKLNPPFDNVTKWEIPLDRIISTVPRLQPRYYSISSSSKLYPSAVHVTAVVLKYSSTPSKVHENNSRFVYGLSTNFIHHVMQMSHNGTSNGIPNGGNGQTFGGLAGADGSIRLDGLAPTYKISGPRDFHLKDNIYRVPVHIRRSTFRLPTSPKVPIIMIGPGTGVAPFRGFVQERVALAKKAREKAGADAANALESWAPIHLFYGCRREEEDFLYREEWPGYLKELDPVFKMHNAFSRGASRKPDGSKIYVQDLIWDLRAELAPLILDKRAYIYICGDAKNMAKSVEDRLIHMLAEARGGTPEVEGVKELKVLKDRNRLMTDVWS
ncbi:hypothetical protein CspHIS471_0212610 [Cutaneotrichosporon sp. HIS471]|nr:hypothetical protein CspHIS471_0212610 [Cutaneotrichosporon sp. HIS471]